MTLGSSAYQTLWFFVKPELVQRFTLASTPTATLDWSVYSMWDEMWAHRVELPMHHATNSERNYLIINYHKSHSSYCHYRWPLLNSSSRKTHTAQRPQNHQKTTLSWVNDQKTKMSLRPLWVSLQESKPIHYASKYLTDSKVNYAHIDKSSTPLCLDSNAHAMFMNST